MCNSGCGQSLTAKCLGKQKGNADTSNFDEEFTKEQPTLTPVHGQLSAQDQAEFTGFSWVGRLIFVAVLTELTDCATLQVASWADSV